MFEAKKLYLKNFARMYFDYTAVGVRFAVLQEKVGMFEFAADRLAGCKNSVGTVPVLADYMAGLGKGEPLTGQAGHRL